MQLLICRVQPLIFNVQQVHLWVCVCTRARVCVCMRMCVRVSARARVCLCGSVREHLPVAAAFPFPQQYSCCAPAAWRSLLHPAWRSHYTCVNSSSETQVCPAEALNSVVRRLDAVTGSEIESIKRVLCRCTSKVRMRTHLLH